MIKEEIFDKELNYSGIPKPFLAYSMPGSIVYVGLIDLKKLF
jgi:hypothetical protein